MAGGFFGSSHSLSTVVDQFSAVSCKGDSFQERAALSSGNCWTKDWKLVPSYFDLEMNRPTRRKEPLHRSTSWRLVSSSESLETQGVDKSIYWKATSIRCSWKNVIDCGKEISQIEKGTVLVMDWCYSDTEGNHPLRHSRRGGMAKVEEYAPGGSGISELMTLPTGCSANGDGVNLTLILHD